MAPKATDVCKRLWISPLSYLAIIMIVTGFLGAIATLAIGYYMVYREGMATGLCFADNPGIRRSCILDLGGGVMSMISGVLLLIIEFTSVYINQRDWKITFLVVKMVIAVLVTTVLGAGTIQGAVSYAEYCDDDDYYGDDYKRCDFSNSERQHDPDVDFVAVVITTGICAFFWVILFGVEIIRLCLILSGVTNDMSTYNNFQDARSELQQLPIAELGTHYSPQHYEM